MLDGNPLKIVGSWSRQFFLLTPKMNFEKWLLRTCGESSWRDVEPSKPGFDVWMKFLNNSKSYSVFFFVVGFSCSSTNSVPRLWSRQTCLAPVYNRLKTLFRLAKDQRKNSKKTIQTTENQKCALTARKNTVSWLVKNDATHVWIEMISWLVE